MKGSFLGHSNVSTPDNLLMLLNIESISNLNFARIEKPMPIFKARLADLNLGANNIPIAKLNFLKFDLGLEYITVSNLTIGNIRFNTEDIV